MRIEDEAPLTVVAILRGAASIALAGAPAETLAAGDIAIVRGPSHYVVADPPGTAPQIVIDVEQRCTTLRGEPLVQAMDLGVRSWGNDPDGQTVMLTGTYQRAGELSRRLLEALPPLITLASDDWSSPLVDVLAEEIVRDPPGQQAVLDRLLDLVLVTALRHWFERPGAPTPLWFGAMADDTVGRALRTLHNDPGGDWTVASLAASVGVSRAALARRFTDLVGEPPMTYLSGWRLAMAADLLAEPGATVTAVATQVGYHSPFTFSAAFKRRYGHSPRDHRRRSVAEQQPEQAS